MTAPPVWSAAVPRSRHPSPLEAMPGKLFRYDHGCNNDCKRRKQAARAVSLDGRRSGQNRLKALAAGGHRAVDVVLGVRRTDKQRLKLGGRQENSPVRHFSKKGGEPACIGFLGARVIADPLLGEENRQ